MPINKKILLGFLASFALLGPASGAQARTLSSSEASLLQTMNSVRTSYHLAPSVVARTGAIAVGALLSAPLAALAARRRWSAFVLGGTVLVLAIELWSPAFTHFSDLVSLSQSRRAAGFVPFALIVSALRHISATRAGITAMLEPVVAIIVAWAWLGESLRPVQLSGAALTLLGIGLAQTAR